MTGEYKKLLMTILRAGDRGFSLYADGQRLGFEIRGEAVTLDIEESELVMREIQAWSRQERGRHPLFPARAPKKGEVWRSPHDGRKRVLRISAMEGDLTGWTFVCERPHADEDFSYMCGSSYCRCCQ